MQENKDYIKKEIEKVILFLKRIINKIKHSDTTQLENELTKDTNECLKENLFSILHLEENQFKEKVNELNYKILEELFELCYQLAKKDTTENRKVYIEKALILHEIINEKAQNFSLQRLQQKQELAQL